MKKRTSIGAITLLALGLWSSAPDTQAAEHYPSKPITLVVPGPPAGGIDLWARILAPELSQSLGQPIVIENLAGAGGIIGAKFVARAAPDGYTILMGDMMLMDLVPVVIKRPPYDPLTDFVPVGMVSTTPDVLVVRGDSGIKSVKELLATSSAKHPLSYGSSGVGSSQHIEGFALSKASGVSMLHVPYRGSAPALQDVLAGRISFMFVNPSAAAPYLKTHRLVALAVASPTRSRFFPEVPTMAEVGFPSVERLGWSGLLAPAHTPAPVIQLLSQKLEQVLAIPSVQKQMQALYNEPPADSSSKTFSALIKREVPIWANRIHKLGIAAQ